MSKPKDKIQKNQKKFFNDHSSVDVEIKRHTPVLDKYENKEQYEGFDWIQDSATILDYGCGTATSIDRFFSTGRDIKKYEFIGVDIADKALEKAKNKYPEFMFYPIKNNKLDCVENESLDSAYIIHVLHHSTGHEQFFREIYAKLKPGGKLLMNDLSSRNPIINTGRKLFGAMPQFIKKRFSNDLVVNDAIPDKYPVDIDLTVELLKKTGFKIIKVGHGHLFFFLFLWVDNFAKISKNRFVSKIYETLIRSETYLLGFDFFKKYAELFYIYAARPDGKNSQNVPESGNYSTSFNSYVYNLIPVNTLCLDIGCWNGNLGHKLIADKKCTVDGVDVNQEMLNETRKKGYEDTYNINLNDSTCSLNLIGKKYDVIVFADILEHLIDPQKILKNFRSKLNDDGIIIISLPNVAFILNRLNLLLGKWNYREFGTLDKTHLKFFTVKTATDLVRNSGYKVRTVQPYNQFGILERMKFLLSLSPELFAYQIIIVAEKDGK